MNLSFRHYYWRWIKNQFLLFIIFVAALSACRLFFVFLFGDWTEIFALKQDFYQSLMLGVRFDLIPLAYIHILPFTLMNLAYFIPGRLTIRLLRSLLLGWLIFGHLLLIWIYIFDYAFFSYFQDHLNILFFGFFEDDTVALLTSVWKNYNLPLWLGLIFLGHWGLIKLIKLFFSPFDFALKARSIDWRMLLVFMPGLVGLAYLARGNFSRLPLSIEDAHISTNDFINKVSLNGAITLNRAIKIRKTYGIKSVDYLTRFGFKDWQTAFTVAFGHPPASDNLSQALKVTSPVLSEVKKNPPHVVLVVMESFGSYWNSLHSEKFNLLGSLEEHFDQGMLFKNFLPAENGTIGSIVSVATSQVIRPGARFLSESEFMRTPLQSAGHLPYKTAGYETHFVYGGKLGWRDLGRHLTTQKFDNLWGADEIKESMPELNNISSEDLGNEWGIFDEYLYAFIEEQLRISTKPQFFLVLTTTNHPPFEYPSTYNPHKIELNPDFLNQLTISQEMAKKRFSGLQYANQKMGDFLTRVKNSGLKNKTVVALTGDHSYWVAKGVGLEEEFKRYAVPFFISVPERLRPKQVDLNNFGSHEDIFPTLYELTLSEASYIKLGESLISETGLAINSSGLAASKDGVWHHDTGWLWDETRPGDLKATEDKNQLSSNREKMEALIALTDLYLKEEKKRKPTDAKNGPQ